MGAIMTELPRGTLTFLFTDIEGSTTRWEHQPEAMRVALKRHDALVRGAIESHGGIVFKTVGDAFYAVFRTAVEAVAAAEAAQRGLAAEAWNEEIGSLSVRMGLHVGTPECSGDDYFGQPLNRVARLMSAGHGGQVLLSLPVAELVRDTLPAGAALRDLGEHRLKDLLRPEHIYQLIISGLPDSFPALKTLDAHPNNLPIPPTPLLGRERELEALHDLVLGDDRRLVTLHGPGGTGKTRLSLQVAADLSDHFADGVYFVPLAAVKDANLFLPVVAQTIGLRASGNQSLEESVMAALSEKSMLLVLDNLEQIVEGAAPVVADLLLSAPRLKLLVTSQAILRLQGEHIFEVPPLGLPSKKRKSSLAELLQTPAIQLFVERAQATKLGFELTDSIASSVVQICAYLDGMPLAIELAAARTKILTPQAIVERLGAQMASSRASGVGRLKLLTGGARDLPTRQQTLLNTLAWSYDLLDEAEQALFRRLSGFLGGWTFEAAEAVCAAAGDLDLDVLDGLESLADKSLIRHEEESSGGEPRFLMLQSIREYGLELLAQHGEMEALRRAHAAYYLAFAQDAERALAGPEQGRWLGQLEDEHENLRAALEWARDSHDAALAIELSGTLGRFWVTRGYHGEGHAWLEEALAMDGGSGSGSGNGSDDGHNLAPARAKALHRLATIDLELGDYPHAAARYEESLSLYREVKDERGTAIALNGLGGTARYEGDYSRAQALFEESLALLRTLGDRAAIPGRLMNLGQVVARQGDYARAEALFEESLGLSRAQGNTRAVVLTLESLGVVAFTQGDLTRATPLFHESLALAWQLGMKYEVALILHYLGEVERREGHLEHAAQLFGAAEALHDEIGGSLPADEQHEFAQFIGRLREALGSAAFSSAWDNGQSMPADDVVASVLAQVAVG